MIFCEEQGDLFSEEIIREYALCHCISSDFALGAGIAKIFAKMGVKKKLVEQYQKLWQGRGYCHFTNVDGVLVANLVTKERYFHKPTLETLRQSLEDLRNQALERSLKKLAMPKIGCGLDKLEWSEVKKIINEVFKDTEIEILVKII